MVARVRMVCCVGRFEFREVDVVVAWHVHRTTVDGNVAYVGNNKAVALCDVGVYLIDCTNGSYSQIADSKWPVG